jgi:putative phosphonate metabolism protein
VRRFAIYFAPPRAHPLWQAGCALLGRDPETGEALRQPPLAGIDPARFAAITADARRYGWHATLKPPFALADGATEEELRVAVAHFARSRPPFPMPPLRLACLSGFLAVVPERPAPALDDLAAAAVRALDPFRRPATPEELLRRRAAGLDAIEERNLERWGYPYVMERFRFHMTLTARLEDAEREAVAASVALHLAPALAAPLVADAVALYVEPAPGAPFRLSERFALGG